MVKFRYLLFILVTFITFSINAQEASVKAYTDSTKYFVGDYITYHIQVTHDKALTVNKPNVKDSLKDAELIKYNKTTKELDDKTVLESFDFTIAKYDSGNVIIPSIKVELLDKKNNISNLYTNKLVVAVTTLDVDQQKEIMDVKAPIKIDLDWLFISIALLIIAILALIGYYVYQYYKKRKLIQQGIIKEVVIPPYELAYNMLKELEEKKLWQKGQVKDYHTELTFIVRKYFEDQFKFGALEMTSAEILDYLRQKNFKLIVAQTLEAFFSNADMVKFAKFQPLPSINETMLKEAYMVIDESKVVVEPPKASEINAEHTEEVKEEVKNV